MLFRHTDAANSLDRLIALLKAAAAFIMSAGRQIGAYDEKLFAHLEVLVPDACWDDDDVARRDINCSSLVAAKAKMPRARYQFL